MDVNSLRRSLLAIASSVDIGVEITTITCNSAIANGEQLGTFITNNVPQCERALVICNSDFNTKPSVQNTVTYVLWSTTDTTVNRYCRYRSGAYNYVPYFSSPYDAYVPAGQTFTVIYLKKYT